MDTNLVGAYLFDSFPAGVLAGGGTAGTATRIAVDQSPFGGQAYPFTRRHALGPLVLDFYLAYTDDAGALTPPLRLVWLYGGGAVAADPVAGMPAPTHPRDLVVADARGRVVFDSTTAAPDQYLESSWGARQVVQWLAADAVGRLVLDSSQTWDYAVELAYSDAVLDARTWERLPRRVRALRVGLATLTGPVALLAGYNAALSATAAATEGGRAGGAVHLDGVAGAGAGRAGGCPEVATVRTINQIGPDPAGVFRIAAGGCHRAAPPTRETAPAGGVRQAEYAAAGYSGAQAAAALELANDCTPCCGCADFADTYRGLSLLWDQWQALASWGMKVRDRHGRNVARWTAQADCRALHALQFSASPEPACKSGLAAQYCNRSSCCGYDVRVRFTVQQYVDGVLNTGTVPGALVSAAWAGGPDPGGEAAAAPAVYSVAGGFVVEFAFDRADPQGTVTAKARLCASCDGSQSLRVTASVHVAGTVADQNGSDCSLPAATVPGDVSALWTAAGLDDVPAVAISDPTGVAADPSPNSYACGC